MDDYTSAPLPAELTNARRIYILWNYTTCTVYPLRVTPHDIVIRPSENSPQKTKKRCMRKMLLPTCQMRIDTRARKNACAERENPWTSNGSTVYGCQSVTPTRHLRQGSGVPACLVHCGSGNVKPQLPQSLCFTL